MTDSPRPFRPDSAPPRPDFDLVEDLGAPETGDQEAFDRAVSALLPHEGKARAAGGSGVDIDLDDFEAFNRELDARLAEARAHPVEDDPVEDLGAEIVPAAAASPPPTRGIAGDRSAPPARADTMEVPDDVVTLGASAKPASVPLPSPSRAPAPSQTPAPKDSTSAPPPATRGTGSGLALALGTVGLLAGAAGLWVNHARDADFARLESVVKAESVPIATAAPSVSPELLKLDARISEISHRVEALSAAASEAGVSSSRALHGLEERLARAEAQLAAARTLEHAPLGAREPPKPAAEPAAAAPKEAPKPAADPSPTMAKVSSKEAAKTSAAAAPAEPKAPAKPAESPIAAPQDTAKPAEMPTADTASAPLAPAAAVKGRKPLPKAAGGSWVVVVESFPTEGDAYRRLNRVENMGLVADVIPAQLNGQIWHRLVVPGYGSQDDAKAIAADLRARGLGQPWVYQRKGE